MRKLVLAVFVSALAVLPTAGSAIAGSPDVGSYLRPIREDGAVIALTGKVLRPGPGYDEEGCAKASQVDASGAPTGAHDCLAAAASLVQLADGRILYWNALEGSEQNYDNAVMDAGKYIVSVRSRVMTLHPGNGATWTKPSPEDGGAHESGNTSEDLPLGPLGATHRSYNDGSLFCANQVHLPDGRVFVTGGTNWHSEPNVPGAEKGVVELEGVRSSRVFDPASNTWKVVAQMNHGRWYPSLVTLPDGKLFVASGVTKLIKPAYPSHPADSGRNVVFTETFDPATNKWTDNGPSGERSLPLFPRLHTLPNGKVYYDAAGQAFNPMGYGYDELGWNNAAVYDPATKAWTDLGMPAMGSPMGGFRGSTFSAALPMRPDKNGQYRQASFLTGGGVLFPTPGSYFPVADTRINNVTIGADGKEALSTVTAGPMLAARWYGSGVPLPDGTVYAVNGGDLDHVSTPGLEGPILQAELFTPKLGKDGTFAGGTWRAAGKVSRPRTYHNTAMLLPDGRVLIAGNAPIPTGYHKVINVPGRANNFHDASFQIYAPPYVNKARPVIADVAKQLPANSVVRIATPDAAHIASVVLLRNSAATHLVDGDVRNVQLQIVRRLDEAVEVRLPSSTVLAAGPYLLFINQNRGNVNDDAPGHVVPSKGAQVFVTAG